MCVQRKLCGLFFVCHIRYNGWFKPYNATVKTPRAALPIPFRQFRALLIHGLRVTRLSQTRLFFFKMEIWARFWASGCYRRLNVCRIKCCLWFLLIIVVISTTLAVNSLPYMWAQTRALTIIVAPTGIDYSGLSSVHISIKSTENYRVSRLPVLGMTWLQTVPSKNVCDQVLN